MGQLDSSATGVGSVLIRTLSRLIVFGGALAALLGCARSTEGPGSSAAPRRIDLRSGGDDGLTVRFRDALEDAIRDDHDFVLALGNEARTPSTVVATIDGHLRWKTVESRTQVSYKIKIEGPTEKSLGSIEGSCWEDELSACATQALAELRRTTKGKK